MPCPIGQGIFLRQVKVDAVGWTKGKLIHVEQLLVDERETNATASVAAAVAERMYRTELPHGGFHIEQCFSCRTFRMDFVIH